MRWLVDALPTPRVAPHVTALIATPCQARPACYVPTLFTIRTTYIVPLRCLAAFGGEAKRPMHS